MIKDLMKLFFVVLIVYLAKTYYDGRHTNLLVGDWEFEGRITQGAMAMDMDFISTYSADGICISEGTYTWIFPGNVRATARMKAKSIWRTSGNTLYETPTEISFGRYSGDSDAYEFLDLMAQEFKSEIGNEMAVEIIRLNKEILEIKDEQGLKILAIRQ